MARNYHFRIPALEDECSVQPPMVLSAPPSMVMMPSPVATPRTSRPLHRTPLFISTFSCVCPEPVLGKRYDRSKCKNGFQKGVCFPHRIVTQRVCLSAIKLGAAHEPKRVDAVGFSCRNEKKAFCLNTFPLPRYVRPKPVLVTMIVLTYILDYLLR